MRQEEGTIRVGQVYPGEWCGTTDPATGARALCAHRSPKRNQVLFVQPRFRSDGKQMAYASDVLAYGQVFVAEVPDSHSLPESPEPGRRA